MSCPTHDCCTCYGTSLQYTTSITTATGSSQVAPQSSNLFFGYEWATPLVAASTAPWHTIDPVSVNSSTSYSASDLSQPDCYLPGSTYETLPSHFSSSRAHAQEQNPAFPSRERTMDQYKKLPAYPTPYIQGISRMAIPMPDFSRTTLPGFQAHQGYTSSFENQEEFLQTESKMGCDQSAFDEPPPPYTNHSLVAHHPLSNNLPPSAVLTRHLRNVGPITSSPLAPVPLRHSSLFQVLKHESPASPSIGTFQHSRVSSLAHALEPQGPQARQTPLPCTPALGDRQGTFGISAPSPSATQMSSMSLNLVAPGDACPTLVQVPPQSVPAHAQGPLSSETPSINVTVNATTHSLSLVTPLSPRTLAPSFPEVANQDYEMVPRPRKLHPALLVSVKEEQPTESSPLSSLSSSPSTSTGASTVFMNESKNPHESAFTLPLLGRKRPVLRAKLACLFCRRRKIQCRPLPGDHKDKTCQQCAKRCRKCEYPEMTWRGRGRKRSRSPELEESDKEEESLPVTKIKLET